jgi:hypothetical protein
VDGTAAINHNLEALKRILAGLVAMAGLGGPFTSPQNPGTGGGRREASGGGCDSANTPTRRSDDCRPPLKGEVRPSFTLPRYLRLAILRLLRPAEAAARRLIIAAARGLAVVLPPPRKRAVKPVNPEPFLRRFGIAVVMSPADLVRADAARRAAALRAARPRTLSLPLFDPPRRLLSPKGRRYVPAHAAPRILLPGITQPYSLPPPPSPDDPIDATRLSLRLAALAAALDDLPGQAKRFARWKARQDAQNKDHDTKRKAPAPGRRISPLRSGRPPGGRLSRFDPSARSRRNIREVDEILAHAHALALYALQYPDTS